MASTGHVRRSADGQKSGQRLTCSPTVHPFSPSGPKVITLEPLGDVPGHLGIDAGRGDQDLAVLEELNVNASADALVVAELACEDAIAVAKLPPPEPWCRLTGWSRLSARFVERLVAHLSDRSEASRRSSMVPCQLAVTRSSASTGFETAA